MNVRVMACISEIDTILILTQVLGKQNTKPRPKYYECYQNVFFSTIEPQHKSATTTER